MSIFKLTVSSLNAIFANLSEDNEKVFWIRNPDYSQQLFLNSTYEKIWDRSVEELYQHPSAWNQYLIGENSEEFVQLLTSRTPVEAENNFNNNVFYRIKKLDDQTMWIKDAHFYIFNENNQQVAVAGLAKAISETQWLAELNNCEKQKSNGQLASEHKQLNQILKDEFNFTSVPSTYAVLSDKPTNHPHIIVKDGTKVLVSKREMECLSYLIKGKTAKEIARDLKISPRTVEIHIAHKRKIYIN